ncbi:MAG: hypothetical protein RI907_912 [Pseudomonadota bacterium]
MQPQSFLPKGESIQGAAVLLNQYTADQYSYNVLQVDGKGLGNGRIYEIYLSPGRHKIKVMVNAFGALSFVGQTYVGELDCDFRRMGFYTIGAQSGGRPDMVDKNSGKAMLVSCVEHDSKPENPALMKFIKDHGWTLSTELFVP